MDINYDDYTEEYKSKRLNEAWQIYYQHLQENKNAIVEKLDDIHKIELENENIIELDGIELANALAIIESAQGKIAPDMMTSFAKTFAGKHQALVAIESALKKYDKAVCDDFAKYVINTNDEIYKLSKEAGNLEEEPISAPVALKHLYDGIISYGEKLGLTFGSFVADIGKSILPSYEKAMEKIARKEMGLEYLTK